MLAIVMAAIVQVAGPATIILGSEPVAVRRALAPPTAEVGKIDFKGQVRAAFCKEKGKLCLGK